LDYERRIWSRGMRRSQSWRPKMKPLWILIPLLATGCGASSKEAARMTEAAIAHAPPAERQNLLMQEHRIDVAETNVASARTGLDEGKQFSEISNGEALAAEAKLDTARKGASLGQQARNANIREAAESNEEIAKRQVVAARAMQGYADGLVKLRQARLDQANAELKLARAERDAAKIAITTKSKSTKESKEAQSHSAKAADELPDPRLRVQQLEGQATALRDVWLEKRHARQTASRAEPVVDVPPQPSRTPAPDPQ